MTRPPGDPTDDLPPLSKPARAAFAQAGITRLDHVAGRRASDLLAMHGVGPTSIRQLRAALAAAGLPPLT